MTITRELVNKIKVTAVSLIESHDGLKFDDLYIKILAEYLNAPPADILLALSEIAQDGQVKRIEYQSSRKGYHYKYFYLPYDSRLS